MKILIIEDEDRLGKLISKELKREGYACDLCYDGEEGLYFLTSTTYDAVVLDLMLPKMDGLTLLKTARDKGILTPVLILTAKADVADKVAGLDMGADDYLTKPFSLEELTARLRVLIRRNGVDRKDSIIRCGPLTLDTKSKVAIRQGIEIQLTGKEYAILEYLMHNKGIVISRAQIGMHIWSYDYDGASNAIEVYIRSLRRKIDEPFDRKLIRTKRGIGYIIIGD